MSLQAVVRLARRLSVVAGVALVAWPDRAPVVALVALTLTLEPLARAWRAARGTALRASAVWALAAVVLGILAEALAAAEPLGGGRPASGHVAYLAVLAALAGLISVLNARTPGGGAWAALMALLIVVFLIPWLESSGLGPARLGPGRLRLNSPWTIFYGLLVLAGTTNHLPTRYGPASAWLALGFGLEYLGLTRLGRSPSGRGALWAAVPWTFAAAVAAAELRARGVSAARGRLEAVWFWFRDRWGVVWALRVQDRFNHAAEASGWPFRLAWHGLVDMNGNPAASPSPAVSAAALATLKGLLRRFAEPARIDRADLPNDFQA